MDKLVQDAIESFLYDTDTLYKAVLIRNGTLIDPPEYMEYCILCLAAEREHRPCCLFYPLFIALQ